MGIAHVVLASKLPTAAVESESESDWPSRLEGERALALVNASMVEAFPIDASLVARLLGKAF